MDSNLLSGLYTGSVRLQVGLHHDGLYLARSPSFTVCFYLFDLAVWRVILAVYFYRSGMPCRGGQLLDKISPTSFFRQASFEVTRFVRSSREWWTYFSRYTYVDEWNLPMILETVI